MICHYETWDLRVTKLEIPMSFQCFLVICDCWQGRIKTFSDRRRCRRSPPLSLSLQVIYKLPTQIWIKLLPILCFVCFAGLLVAGDDKLSSCLTCFDSHLWEGGGSLVSPHVITNIYIWVATSSKLDRFLVSFQPAQLSSANSLILNKTFSRLEREEKHLLFWDFSFPL